MSSPKIILYTNRICPWAHRAHIALKELGLDYEEVTIDLSTPREPWYLEINPVSDKHSSQHLHPYYTSYTINCILTSTPTARPRPHNLLQRDHNNRIRHRRPIPRRRPPKPPPPSILPSRKRPLPRPSQLLRRRLLQQSPPSILREYSRR